MIFMHTFFREPLNSLTHLFGIILSAVAMIVMLVKTETMTATISVIIFGVSLLLLYSASTIYHGIKASPTVISWLRKVDHAMIFVLIAGTYTPFCLIPLRDSIGIPLLIAIWAIALSGIGFKLIWFHCPRIISTFLYIGMGWIIVFVFQPLADHIETAGLVYLVLGGVIYTLGGVIYAIKPKSLEFNHLGFHEIFHLFILAGSLCHFLAINYYVL
ncbi:hemolysin III [Halolactibacillus miurensis]|uniref:Hemolysin III n=2 Tax=Halolactibacillus miurensis TaxID=306541 RepID=A0A1I6UNU8_9BACI|nr:hemolysin III [Halolactibacillus miurensis]